MLGWSVCDSVALAWLRVLRGVSFVHPIRRLTYHRWYTSSMRVRAVLVRFLCCLFFLQILLLLLLFVVVENFFGTRHGPGTLLGHKGAATLISTYQMALLYYYNDSI